MADVNQTPGICCVSPRRSVYEFACENIDAGLPALPIQEPGAFLGDK